MLAGGFFLPPHTNGFQLALGGDRGLEIDECLLKFLFNMDLRNLQMPIKSLVFPSGPSLVQALGLAEGLLTAASSGNPLGTPSPHCAGFYVIYFCKCSWHPVSH